MFLFLQSVGVPICLKCFSFFKSLSCYKGQHCRNIETDSLCCLRCESYLFGSVVTSLFSVLTDFSPKEASIFKTTLGELVAKSTKCAQGDLHNVAPYSDAMPCIMQHIWVHGWNKMKGLAQNGPALTSFQGVAFPVSACHCNQHALLQTFWKWLSLPNHVGRDNVGHFHRGRGNRGAGSLAFSIKLWCVL